MRDSEVLAAHKQTVMREDSASISDINGKKIKLQEKLLQVRLANKIGSGKETFLRAVCGASMKTCKL